MIGPSLSEMACDFHKALKDNSPVRKEDVACKWNNTSLNVNLQFIPFAVLPSSDTWLLVLFEDHLVQRVVFRKVRRYSDIDYVDVSATDTENLDIAYRDSRLTFSAKLADLRDFESVLRFFDGKGVRLGDRARRMLGTP